MGESTLQIRPVEINEINLLVNISRETFHRAFAHLNHPEDMQLYIDNTFTTANLLREFNTTDCRFYFAVVDTQIAGYIKLNYPYVESGRSNPHALEIERLYVLSPFQGKSIGTQMIEYAADEARKLNCIHVVLGVWEHNTNAVRFYERHGFSRFSEHDFMLGSDRQTDWLMQKQI